MRSTSDDARADKLYLKALNIREGNANGLWVPILQHLALRGHSGAMIDLANWFCGSNSLRDLGATADAFSAAGLYRRAYRKGDARAAQHLAMGCFNRNDLRGYRLWLGRAARTGDGEAAVQLRRFETRLWHDAARRIGRLRPHDKRDEFA
jgi:TPR repeat protein